MLFLLLIVGVLAWTAGIPPRPDVVSALQPAPRLQSYHWMSLAQWFRMHAEDVELAEAGDAKVVFLGDSITEGWAGTQIWSREFEPLPAVNFGIGGDMTQNLLWRLRHGAVGNLRPSAVVLLIGTNNFGFTRAAATEVAAGIGAVVAELRRVFPDARILLFGIFPRDVEPDTRDRRRIRDVNARIAALHDGAHVFYEDIGARFLEADGRISHAVMPDALHLSEEGYRRWAAAIRPYLRSWIGHDAETD